MGAISVSSAQQPTDLPAPDGKVILEVHGAISNTNSDGVARYDRAMLRALPRVRIETSTSVTDGVHAFDGFLVRDLLEQVGTSGSSVVATALNHRSEEHTSELQSLMRISYAVFCLKKKK